MHVFAVGEAHFPAGVLVFPPLHVHVPLASHFPANEDCATSALHSGSVVQTLAAVHVPVGARVNPGRQTSLPSSQLGRVVKGPQHSKSASKAHAVGGLKQQRLVPGALVPSPHVYFEAPSCPFPGAQSEMKVQLPPAETQSTLPPSPLGTGPASPASVEVRTGAMEPLQAAAAITKANEDTGRMARRRFISPRATTGPGRLTKKKDFRR